MILTQPAKPIDFVQSRSIETQDRFALLDILAVSKDEISRGEMHESQEVFQFIRSRLNAKQNAGNL